MLQFDEATLFPDSDFGDTPQDKYVVFINSDGIRGPQQTGCFVLRPSREPEAFEALCVYTAQLKDGFKKDRLTKWIERFRSFKKEKKK